MPSSRPLGLALSARMASDGPPTQGNGDGRYVTWREWSATLRPAISRELETGLVRVEEDVMEVKRDIGKVQDLLSAAPEGDKPGGLQWQMNALRSEQQRARRNIIFILGALSFVFNIASPWIQGIVTHLLGVPKP